MSSKDKLLRDATIGELEERLIELELKKKRDSIPTPIDEPDFSDLVEMCQEYLYDLAEGNALEDADEHIFEEALGAIFGDTVFNWINEQL